MINIVGVMVRSHSA